MHPAPQRPVRLYPSSLVHDPLSALLEYSSGAVGAAHPERGDQAARGSPAGGPGAAPGTLGMRADEANEEAVGGRIGGGVWRWQSAYQELTRPRPRWLLRALPFILLLLCVFIRLHPQGFFVMVWIAAVMFKSNGILLKQTALKGERKIPLLVGIMVVLIIHVRGVYWLYRCDDLVRPLVMLPPKEIPPFWHALFFIMLNDTMLGQAAMVIKCMLLMYYKNSKDRHYRRQGQMLTVVEYCLLLYRTLSPAPVWYRFFLNEKYGSIFSSVITGFYLTLKLTYMVEKVRSLLASVRALSRNDLHYGSHATLEQVLAVGDMCAICQEKMHTPILLECEHIFCEDCTYEWFERERTCPLCRALVAPGDIPSFRDGSTTLLFQLF